MNPDLTVQLNRLSLRNPILTASGCCGYGLELADLIDLNRLGGMVSKSLTLHRRIGTPPHRIVETAAGMLNAIGIENIGVDAFVDEKLPQLREYSLAVIANIMGNTIEEYQETAKKLNGVEGIAGLEVNISSPNTKKGGMHFGVDPEITYQVIRAVRDTFEGPLIAKLSPNVTDIVYIGKRAVDAGAEILSLINTLWSLAIDVRTRKPILGNITGGLSGPAIKPVALRMVWQVSRAIPVPVIGIGGIACLQDVLEFIIAGASAVQIGTASFYDPTITTRLVGELEQYCRERKIASVRELVGTLQA